MYDAAAINLRPVAWEQLDASFLPVTSGCGGTAKE
jgi:hypothetical protein